MRALGTFGERSPLKIIHNILLRAKVLYNHLLGLLAYHNDNGQSESQLLTNCQATN